MKKRGPFSRLFAQPLEPYDVRPPAAILEVSREGVVPLATGGPRSEQLELAAVVPPFRRGSGGHSTVVNLLRALEQRGHRCSVWIDGEGDPALFEQFFGAPAGGVNARLDGFAGADFVLATGWQTVHRVLRLPGCRGRAYLVQDHEPDFYGASAEQHWAQDTYRLALPAIAASPWLAAMLRHRYGAEAHAFDLGVDHETYAPAEGVERGAGTVAFYARASTARRAVPLGLLALEELHRRRPQLELVLFGEGRPVTAAFPHRWAGLLDGPALARLYSEAAAGLVLSLTNPSLVPTEMLACGLPVVDVASDSMRATFGDRGPIELADADPVALAAAIEAVIDDPGDRSAIGIELAAMRTWPRAAEQVEQALKTIAAGV